MQTIPKLRECSKKKKKWVTTLESSVHTLALTYAIQNAKRESTLFVDKYLLLA